MWSLPKWFLPVLEAILAIALAVSGSIAIFHWFPYLHDISFFAPNAFVYVGFYVVKCVFAYCLHGETGWATFLYVFEVIVLVGLMAFGEPFGGGLTDLWDMFLFGFCWCVVPTVTFAFDLMALKTKPSPRLLIWRSLLEILVVRPCWNVVALLILMVILTLLGVFPVMF